jgi:hypothetical protein
MNFEHALHEWHEFFFLFGTAGATLIALLFVAVSLGTGFLTAERADAMRTFFSPVVIHFSAVFVISSVSLVPGHRTSYFAALIGISALIGLIVSIWTTYQMFSNRWSQLWEDRLAYGALPAASYAALCGAAFMIYVEDTAALDVLGASLLALLLINIRNAWDLTLDMVRRHSDP